MGCILQSMLGLPRASGSCTLSCALCACEGEGASESRPAMVVSGMDVLKVLKVMRSGMYAHDVGECHRAPQGYERG